MLLNTENNFVAPIPTSNLNVFQPQCETPNVLADCEAPFMQNLLVDCELPCQLDKNTKLIENRDLLLAFAYRHKVSDSAMEDLFLLFQNMDLTKIPKNTRELYSYSKAKSHFFCYCPKKFKSIEFMCDQCNLKSDNYFCVPDFFLNLKRIFSYNHLPLLLQDVTLYTDGINIFEKSKYSLWPIFLSFNSLPLSERYKLSNILICGIWYGKKKPDMQVLFDIIFFPNIKYFNEIFTICGVQHRLRIKYIVADKPARSMILNMQSSNAQYFCPICLCRNQVTIYDGKRHIFVPYSPNNSYLARTHAGFTAIAYSAESCKKPEYGIKGICFLQNIIDINLIDSNIFDYMHSICLGVFKSLLNLLFISNSSSYSLRSSTKDFDCVLSSIKFSSQIVKSPPLISNSSLWKAKDFRNFFLFCLPFLFQKNFSLMMDGIFSLRKGIILLLDQATLQSSLEAEQCFENFLHCFKTTFGEHMMTPNFHDLHHLPDMAQKSGSLIELSGFNFEHINGQLSNLCKGNKRLDLQIIRKISSFCDISFPCSSDTTSQALFIKNLFSPKKWKKTKFINSSISFCGKITKIEDLNFLETFSFYSNTLNFFQASRAIVFGKKISTVSYSINKKFSDSCFLSKSFSHAIFIDKFILAEGPLSKSTYIIAKEHSIDEENFFKFKISDQHQVKSFELESLLNNFSFAICYNGIVVGVPGLEYC